MPMIFTDGVEIKTSGPYRIIEEMNGLYVVGDRAFMCGEHPCGGRKDDPRFAGGARAFLQDTLNLSPLPASSTSTAAAAFGAMWARHFI